MTHQVQTTTAQETTTAVVESPSAEHMRKRVHRLWDKMEATYPGIKNLKFHRTIAALNFTTKKDTNICRITLHVAGDKDSFTVVMDRPDSQIQKRMLTGIMYVMGLKV